MSELTGAQLAKLCELNRSTITRMEKKGTLVKNVKGHYSTRNKKNAEYLRLHSVDPISLNRITVKQAPAKKKKPTSKQKPKAAQKKKSSKSTGKTESEIKEKIKSKSREIGQEEEIIISSEMDPADIARLLGLPSECLKMTLEELVFEHGEVKDMKLYADTLDKVLSAVSRSVKVQKDKNELIERNFVVSHVKTYLDGISNDLFDFAGDDKKMIKKFRTIIMNQKDAIMRELNKLRVIKEKIN